jgi:GTP-dependent dephospho-CoA kinase
LILYRPDKSDLPHLKEPFGKLIPGEPDKTMPELKRLVQANAPRRVTAVGDIVSKETVTAGVPVDLRIVDHISMRKPTASFNINARRTYHVKNPPGVITEESWRAIKQAMKEREVVIYVEGEEDLLTLPCILESPDGSFVLYGQPSEGLVVVTTTPSVKARVSEILGRMTRTEQVSS